MKKNLTWLWIAALAVAIVSVAGTAIHFVIQALDGRDIWAGFMGNFISGLFTLLAGAFAIVLYFIQEHQANVGRLIEWMSTLAERYHDDEEFKEVRVTLAMDRSLVRDRLFSETALNQAAVDSIQLPAFQEYVRQEHPTDVERSGQSYWVFQRKFTDYLYFFEQVLAHGELLRKHNSTEVGAALVDHFGWFLRSLYHCCEIDGCDDWESRQFFVYYLAHNRYRRLTEVGLFLLQGEVDAVEQDPLRKSRERELYTLATRVCGLLRQQRGEVAACNLKQAVARWEKVLYRPAPTAR